MSFSMLPFDCKSGKNWVKSSYINSECYKKTVLAQGEPRDAAVNFDSIKIGIARFSLW